MAQLCGSYHYPMCCPIYCLQLEQLGKEKARHTKMCMTMFHIAETAQPNSKSKWRKIPIFSVILPINNLMSLTAIQNAITLYLLSAVAAVALLLYGSRREKTCSCLRLHCFYMDLLVRKSAVAYGCIAFIWISS